MIRNRFHAVWALVGLMAVGCASRRNFDVTVTNRLGDPITVWMTKAKAVSGDEYERGWMPPEVAAVGTVGSSRSLGGVAVEPGETAHTNLTGMIANDDVAILRVYRAADLNAILALNRGSPDRLDIPLDPGKTDIDIVRQNGQLVEVPHGATTEP
jgi:hypothetical protein